MSKRHASNASRIARVNDALKAAKEFLLPFTLFTKPDYRPNWHHKELARLLDRVADGQCRRLMVFMPPQHGKSELVSRRFPAFPLGRNRRLRVLTFNGYGTSLQISSLGTAGQTRWTWLRLLEQLD